MSLHSNHLTPGWMTVEEAAQLERRRFERAEIAFAPAAQVNPPRTTRRICLSCGARQSLDGSLPCGH